MAKKASVPETAKKAPSAPAGKIAASAPVGSTPVSSTPVRNSAIPKTPARPTLTHDLIARRAYEIYASGSGGSQEDNWLRAEYELRKEMGL
jgi:hypothetical protein